MMKAVRAWSRSLRNEIACKFTLIETPRATDLHLALRAVCGNPHACAFLSNLCVFVTLARYLNV